MSMKTCIRSEKLSELANSVQESGGLSDLVVESGESRVLSSKSNQLKKFYKELKTSSVDEIKDIIGLPDFSTAGTGASGLVRAKVEDKSDQTQSLQVAKNLSITEMQGIAKALPISIQAKQIRQLPAKLIASNKLTDPDIGEEEHLENLSLARTAAHAYIYGDAQAVASWKPLIESYLELRAPFILVPVFQNITVYTGGTLTVAHDTLALYANKIRLYGTGKINCQGPKTIHCSSFEGFL